MIFILQEGLWMMQLTAAKAVQPGLLEIYIFFSNDSSPSLMPVEKGEKVIQHWIKIFLLHATVSYFTPYKYVITLHYTFIQNS